MEDHNLLAQKVYQALGMYDNLEKFYEKDFYFEKDSLDNKEK